MLDEPEIPPLLGALQEAPPPGPDETHKAMSTYPGVMS
jgi:hypothetical protein